MANTPRSTYVFSEQIKNKIEALRQLKEYETEQKATATAVLIELVVKEHRERKTELEKAGIRTGRALKNTE